MIQRCYGHIMQNLFNNCILTKIFFVVYKHFSLANTSFKLWSHFSA